MPAISNRSRPRASFTRRPNRAGSPSSSATSIYSRGRSSRARRGGRAPRIIPTRKAEPISVAEPRQPITKTIVAVAIRPEKVKLSRRGPVSDAVIAHSINRLEGIVTDVSYLGGVTTYKVKLDTGAVLRSSMPNTARIDIVAYNASQRVVAWFTPDDCVVLEQ